MYSKHKYSTFPKIKNFYLEELFLQDAIQIDSSHDTFVYRVDGIQLFEPTLYAKPNTVAVQVCTPLELLHGKVQALAKIRDYVQVTYKLSSFGVFQCFEPMLGVISFTVIENKEMQVNGSASIVSPYIPGPTVEEIMQPKFTIEELSKKEKKRLFDFGIHSVSRKFQLQQAVQLIGFQLHEASAKVHLDQLNCKLRWDFENDRPIILVTDIQNRIGINSYS